MCGIAGIWEKHTTSDTPTPEKLKCMMQAISWRGPDSDGIWTSLDNQLYFGHVRLAIQDLSPFGAQPMASQSARYVTVFNGEIYNFIHLRDELLKLGITFKGHSDTEVLLAAIEAWGIESALKLFDGMFALAVFDTDNQELWLARDRMGEKPLYYAWINNRFIFCSELKGLIAGTDLSMEIDQDALQAFLRFGYYPPDLSPFKNVKKLNPGSYLKISPETLNKIQITADLITLEQRYWYLPPISQKKVQSGSDTFHLEQVEDLLTQAVISQTIADVDVGVFLSGGIDSTLITALLQHKSKAPIKTFTIAFDHPTYNEGPFAKEIANHLGTNHTEIRIDPSECLAAISSLSDLLDEPFADSSIIPFHVVCKAARKHVTVCLSGDGGDEFFGGYNRYTWGEKTSAINVALPGALRRGASKFLLNTPERRLNLLASPYLQIKRVMGSKPEKDLGVKLHKMARALKAENAEELYASLLSFWHTSPTEKSFPIKSMKWFSPFRTTENFIDAAMECDQRFYLVCDNLFKSDRASMLNSLEVRLPLLDRRVVEYANTLPRHLKLREGTTKWALRQILYKHVPRELIDRPKMGFSIPLADWLRGALKEWAEGLLFSESLSKRGFKESLVLKAWKDHQIGLSDNANALWTILTFLLWSNNNRHFIKK